MKYLFVCISLALFAYISANPAYGGQRGGYGGGYGGDRVAYEVVNGGYGGHNGGYGGHNGGYVQPLRSAPSAPRAAAAAASAAAAVRPGSYQQWAVPSWEIDGGYNGPSHGYGRRY
ncbi:uncharacterized protein Dwil_GK16734 [Drosophila willistoni]|uniref:Chorion protein S15 n=1 Tax=Drosophila willistoni TaxID=7260 RepID=B4MME8_DROWI|nr:chorion protein S15 [Drosophila willistoni]EDW73293.1 uncharacterized protein Dwil_GK16734 [Drosophila willistoni]